MNNDPLSSKSYELALELTKVLLQIQREQKEYVLTKQLLKSSTSVAANIAESTGAQSRKDYIAKISVAYKEAKETRFWIQLLSDINLLTASQSKKFRSLCLEIEKMLGKSRHTATKNSK